MRLKLGDLYLYMTLYTAKNNSEENNKRRNNKRRNNGRGNNGQGTIVMKQ